MALDEESSELITSLFALSKEYPKLVRCSVYDAPADPTIKIHSFKMNEFKYYDIPSPFPTLARGLFTRQVETDSDSQKHQIVIRGYDKFFNIDEVPWTKWPYLEANTTPPYTLSLKSNGCIIFIAALAPSTLLVTSKHSLGPVAGVPLSHAEVGEQWLEKHLTKVGKTKEALARILWDNNWTAIAELCDDNFEEHILAYPPEKTGLHLHGINLRCKAFSTQPTEVVDAFAEEWGFIKTPTIVLDSIKAVREFTDECAKTGEWNGEPVEGFVVRTTVTGVPISGRGESIKNALSTGSSTDVSPYQSGSSFFFKIKFDEPYMMYRDWREVTKMLLTRHKKDGKSGLLASRLPTSKMKRPETKVYVKWVIEEIQRNPEDFESYAKGKGVISTRERFLEWLQTESGKEVARAVENEDTSQVALQDSLDSAKTFEKTIILPIAIPGCGKTAIAVALSHIFGFGHVQSDDFKGKKSARTFLNKVNGLLATHAVVIADKNNHLKQHRSQLRELTAKSGQSTRLLALNWSFSSSPPSTTHRICSDRVLNRGTNHQTLIPDTTTTKSHEQIIWKFMNETEELSLNEVDACIEMNLEDTIEEAVRKAIKGVSDILDLPVPEDERIAESLALISAYEPSTKAKEAPITATSDAEVRYFGILPELDATSLLDDALGRDMVTAEGFPVPDEVSSFWRNLKVEGRNTKRPHITIVHYQDMQIYTDLWTRCLAIHSIARGPAPLFKGRLGTILCNGRVLCVTVEDLQLAPAKEEIAAKEASEGVVGEFIENIPVEVKNRLHVTLGTKAEDVPAVESKGLVERWKGGETEGTWAVELNNVEFVGRLKGFSY